MVQNTNTNTVSPNSNNNINVNLDNPSNTSPTYDNERSNSFFLVNRVLNNNIYTSSTDNGRLYNNSLYSYSYTYPRNPVYNSSNSSNTSNSELRTYTVNNNEYNILEPNFSYPSITDESNDPDKPRYNVLTPRIEDE